MKNYIFLFLFFLVGTNIHANHIIEGEKEVKSEIKRVTVFKSGAQVTREAKASIPAGNSQIKFIGISPNIDKRSIQVKGEGDFTILSVVHQVNYFEAPEKTIAIERLEKRRDSLALAIEDETTIAQVLNEEESLILTNKSIGGQQNGVQIENLKATAAFYRERLKEIRLEKLRINRGLKKYQVEQRKVQLQLSELNNKRGIYTSEVVLAIESKSAVKGDFVLSYVVKNAGWFPNYDIRVKDVKNPIKLLYKGNVFQTSGEDWKDVKLTLSTGDPGQSGTKPKLLPWKLDFYVPVYAYGNNGRRNYKPGVYSSVGGVGQARTVSGIVSDEYGEALIGANVLVAGTSIGTVTDVNGRYTLNIPNNAGRIIVSYTGYNQVETQVNSNNMNIVLSEGVLLDEVVVTGMSGRLAGVSLRGSRKDKEERKMKKQEATQPVQTKSVENTTTVEFQIEKPYTIASDGKQYTVRMKEHTLPAYYEYYCVPKLDKDAFLTAQVTGWEDLYLLSGEANLFFEGTYLGRSLLDVQNVSDTLDISLGRDKGIVVTRTKLKEKSKRQLIGNKKTESRSWDIEIRNKKKQSINLVIEDQYPIPVKDEIEVKRINHGNGELDDDTGIVQWKFELGPNTTKKLNLEYSVKYPKKKQVLLE